MSSNNIKEITLWETTDGVRFDNQDEAYKHQDQVVCREKVRNFVMKHFPHSTDDHEHITETLLQFGAEFVKTYESTRCFEETNNV